MKEKGFENNNCFYCDVVIYAVDSITCANCGVIYHRNCWQENNGCCNNHCDEGVTLDKYFLDFKNLYEKKYPNFQYGGFIRRTMAALLDQLILFFFIVIAAIFMGDLVLLAYIPIGWLYHAWMESSKKQATLGKKVMKIIVCDMEGNKISFWRATKRYFSKLISIMTFLIGYMMIIFTEEKQAVHDKLNSCLVIKRI